MRFWNRQNYSCTPDMTPMLDCIFQLTFFFMLTLNFSSDIQSDLIRLPYSELAKPALVPLEWPIAVQVLADGQVLYGGDQLAISALKAPLIRERDVAMSNFQRTSKSATILIRADRDVPIGKVQEVIRVCQEAGFEKYVLRAKTKEA